MSNFDETYEFLREMHLEPKSALHALAIKKGFNGPWYHGGSFDGKGVMKASNNSGMGYGYYFTPHKSVAEGYAKNAALELQYRQKYEKDIDLTTHTGAYYIKMRKPLIIKGVDREDSMFTHTRVFVELGMSELDATKKVDRIMEKEGGFAVMGKQFFTMGVARGYDGILYTYPNDEEAIVWNAGSIKSADEQTFDNKGNPIPYENRFNLNNRDVRY